MAGTTKLMTAGGGGVNLTPASSIASDVTVNVPSQNCTLGIQGPAFSAYANASTSVGSNSFTKVLFQVTEFDTASCYSSSRFTPNIAGYYFISGNTNITGYVCLSIFKNGSEYKRGPQSANNGMYGGGPSGIVYMNGTTDYVELYVYNSGSGTTAAAASETYFNGCLMRAA